MSHKHIKEKSICVYVDEEQLDVLESVANQIGLSPSTFCRFSALKEAKQLSENFEVKNGNSN